MNSPESSCRGENKVQRGANRSEPVSCKYCSTNSTDHAQEGNHGLFQKSIETTRHYQG